MPHYKPQDSRIHRGTLNNPEVRYQQQRVQPEHDGWFSDAIQPSPRTQIIIDNSRSIITRNNSPDIPFSQSINPYRGCEHGCIYCYARPSHAYLDMSPGLDFETKILVKPDAAKLLRAELAKKNYVCSPIALGSNTDPYQQVEIEQGITRQIIEVLAECRHPLSIVTKSALIERDLDVLQVMAKQNLVDVMISVTTLDKSLAMNMEPRAAAPLRRLKTIRRLRDAGVPVGVLFAPVIPFLNDHEMESVLQAVAAAGANSAAYVLLRLPLEVDVLFQDWLQNYYPLKAERIMQRVRDSCGGKNYNATFGQRMSGSGHYADLIAQRFALAVKRFGLRDGYVMPDCSLFTPPVADHGQMSLF